MINNIWRIWHSCIIVFKFVNFDQKLKFIVFILILIIIVDIRVIRSYRYCDLCHCISHCHHQPNHHQMDHSLANVISSEQDAGCQTCCQQKFRNWRLMVVQLGIVPLLIPFYLQVMKYFTHALSKIVQIRLISSCDHPSLNNQNFWFKFCLENCWYQIWQLHLDHYLIFALLLY